MKHLGWHAQEHFKNLMMIDLNFASGYNFASHQFDAILRATIMQGGEAFFANILEFITFYKHDEFKRRIQSILISYRILI